MTAAVKKVVFMFCLHHLVSFRLCKAQTQNFFEPSGYMKFEMWKVLDEIIFHFYISEIGMAELEIVKYLKIWSR